MENYIQQAPIVLVVLFLLIGFVCLIKGADLFVEGSANIAKKFHVPSIIIGLTIVAMGTSLPETSVSVTASLVGNNELAISNAVGSNIFNLMVVIGICAIITPIVVQEETIRRDIPFSLLCAFLLMGLGYLSFGDQSKMVLGHLDGILMLILFAAYIIWLLKAAIKSSKNHDVQPEEEEELFSLGKSILFILIGGVGIALGGSLTVNSASRIALELGMSQTLVGLTIVSIGTSLPELVTSVVAARKNEVDMAIGNAIGSNIFNILMVLGIASTISPIACIKENIIDIAVLIFFTVVCLISAKSRRRIERKEGIIMVLLYAVYAVYIVLR